MMDTIKIKRSDVKMIAHRGLSGIERENTSPAFVAAGNRSYFGIETDVHVTGDGKFIIIHDETLTRVSEGRYDMNVESSTMEDLEDIVLPDKDGCTVRRDIRLPSLAEYIHICKKYGKICVLELKNPFVREDIEKLIAEIASLDYTDSVIFISFDRTNCTLLREVVPNNDVQWLTDEEVTDEVIAFLLENKLDLDIYHSRLNKEIIDKLHSVGISVNCWTCDDPERAESLAEMGVDFITTNILE